MIAERNPVADEQPLKLKAFASFRKMAEEEEREKISGCMRHLIFPTHRLHLMYPQEGGERERLNVSQQRIFQLRELPDVPEIKAF